MKCPNCTRDHKKKDGMVCNCGYTFTFHPHQDQMTDGRFNAILNAASQNGTYHFTLNQLYAAYVRKVRPRVPWRIAISAVGIVLIGFAVAGWSGVFGEEKFPYFFFFLIGLAAFGIPWIDFAGRTPKDYDRFMGMLERWKNQGKDTGMLIEKPTLHNPPPNWTEEDIYDYGAERILIVQRDILVDWLVLNGFHAQEKALIVSLKGYPEYLMPRFEEILANQPDIPVFLLHDASEHGMTMRSRISPKTQGHPIIDLGLNMEDVPRIKKLKGVRPKRADMGTPVDFLPYMMLTGGLGMAMAQQIALTELLTRPATDEAASGSFG